jgi:hypothetical protein
MAKVTISWEARPASENVKFYRVYKVTPWGSCHVGDTTGTSIFLSDVPQGEHTYRITAVNPSGEGLFKEVSASVFPPAGTPGIVNNPNISVAILP